MSAALAALDPTVRNQLLQHLINVKDPEKTEALKIGKDDQVRAAAKISSSDKVSGCFEFSDSEPTSYPELPKGQCLVACVDRWADVQVYAIYTLEQMKSMHQNLYTGRVLNIKWCVLEIPSSLESELWENSLSHSFHLKANDGYIKNIKIDGKEHKRKE